ncbi:MAG: transcriptional regulator [Nitrosopumilus sp.]|nr:transcriptional regulator [Nitrosopumilus sp.]NNL38096.1 transcriptional regulator [Nitrosopumilus sp.]
MAGIDRFIADSLSSEIKKNLNSKILKDTERELFLEHGMSIKLSIEHFQKFVNVLKKNSELNVNKIISDCIKNILKIKKRDDKYIITIVEPNLRDLILELFGEVETRKIISVLLENQDTIPDILKKSKVPKTSGYRKIENLILRGLIVEKRKVLSESKKISELQCIFEEIKLDIKKDKIAVNLIVNNKVIENSTSLKIILE